MRSKEVGIGILFLLLLSPVLAATASIDLGSFSVSNPKIIATYTEPVQVTYASLTYQGQSPAVYDLCIKPSSVYTRDYELIPLAGSVNTDCTGTMAALQPGTYKFTIAAADAGSSPALPTPDERTFRLTGMEITMVAPRFGVGSSAPATVRLRTHELTGGVDTPRPAQCKYDDSTRAVDPTKLAQAYSSFRNAAQSTDGGLTHTLTFGKGMLQVLCQEQSGRITYGRFSVDIDQSSPNLINLSVQPQVVVDPGRKYAAVSFQTDDNSSCTIRQTGPAAGQAQAFPTEDEASSSGYITRHETLLKYDDIDDELEHRFNYTIACKNLAGLSSTRNISASVKLGGAVIIISPKQVINTGKFTLKAQTTFLASSCTASNGTGSTTMARSADDQTIFTADFERPDGVYPFAVTCTNGEKSISMPYTITIDSTPPDAPVIAAKGVICDGKLHASISLADNGTSLVGYNTTVSDSKGWSTTLSGLQNELAVTPPAALGDQVTWTSFATDEAGNIGSTNTTALTNVHIGEDEECGGPAFIRLVRPSALGFASACEGGTVPCKFMVEVATTRPSTCTYSPEATSDTWNTPIPFETSNWLSHTKQVLFTQRRIMVNCTERADQKNHSRIFLVGYDLKAPVINVEVLPGPTVVDKASAILTVAATTDDLTYCYFDAKPFGEGLDTDQLAYETSHVLNPPLDLRAASDGQKTYTVMCKNLAGLSSSKSVNIVVNYKTALRIEVLSPPAFTANRDVTLVVRPNKQSECSYRQNETAEPVALSESDGNHSASLGTLQDGSYSYIVTCTAAADGEQGSAGVQFAVDTRVPIIKSITGKDLLCPGEDITYTVTAGDIDGSPIVEYSFQNVSRNATSNAFTLRTHNLAPASYDVSVAVINRAGLRSQEASAEFEILNGSAPECNLNARHCTNGRRDLGERGIDCGGTCAAACKSCAADADCGKNICQQGLCVAPPQSCSADADCGEGLACESGACVQRKCAADADCGSGQACVAGVCTAGSAGGGGNDNGDTGAGGEDAGNNSTGNWTRADFCANGVMDGDEQDVDCGGSCAQCIACDESTPCQSGMRCSASGICIPDENAASGGSGGDFGGSGDDGSSGTGSQTGTSGTGDQGDLPPAPESHLLSILLIALGIAVMGGAGYYLYQQNEGKRFAVNTAQEMPKNLPTHMAPVQQLSPEMNAKYEQERQAREAALHEAYAKREAEKGVQRKALFEAFEGKAGAKDQAQQKAGTQADADAGDKTGSSAKPDAVSGETPAESAKSAAKLGKDKSNKGKPATGKPDTEDAFTELERIGK
jgi:hypothetical protein